VVLACYAAAALTGTHLPRIPHIDLPTDIHISDKLAHYTMYSGLTMLAIAVGLSSRRLSRLLSGTARRTWIVAATCCALAIYGLVDEATQPWVGRTFDWFDWLANLGGIATAASIMAVLLYFKQPILRFWPSRVGAV
jgi:VanZ family protein